MKRKALVIGTSILDLPSDNVVRNSAILGGRVEAAKSLAKNGWQHRFKAALADCPMKFSDRFLSFPLKDKWANAWVEAARTSGRCTLLKPTEYHPLSASGPKSLHLAWSYDSPSPVVMTDAVFGPRCATCGVSEVIAQKLNFCGKCYRVRYCSRDCQSLHWPKHKSHCGPSTSN